VAHFGIVGRACILAGTAAASPRDKPPYMLFENAYKDSLLMFHSQKPLVFTTNRIVSTQKPAVDLTLFFS
jgi:hypothetical protein